MFSPGCCSAAPTAARAGFSGLPGRGEHGRSRRGGFCGPERPVLRALRSACRSNSRRTGWDGWLERRSAREQRPNFPCSSHPAIALAEICTSLPVLLCSARSVRGATLNVAVVHNRRQVAVVIKITHHLPDFVTQAIKSLPPALRRMRLIIQSLGRHSAHNLLFAIKHRGTEFLPLRLVSSTILACSLIGHLNGIASLSIHRRSTIPLITCTAEITVTRSCLYVFVEAGPRGAVH